MAQKQKQSRRLAAILGRRRWTAKDAARVLAEAKRSALTLRGFSARHAIDPQRLERWERSLRVDAFGSGPIAASAPPVVAFTEVAVADAGVLEQEPPRDERFEVVLRAGTIVRLGSSFDDAGLRRLLRVLAEDGAC